MIYAAFLAVLAGQVCLIAAFVTVSREARRDRKQAAAHADQLMRLLLARNVPELRLLDQAKPEPVKRVKRIAVRDLTEPPPINRPAETTFSDVFSGIAEGAVS